MLKRLAHVSAALLLTACVPALDSNAWFISRYKSFAGFLFEPDSVARA
jgi:hypothetical protein